MKNSRLGRLLLILLLLNVGCTSPGGTTTTVIPTAPSPEVLAELGFASPQLPRITCEELKQAIDNGVALTIVDLAPKEEFVLSRCIPGAINLPYEREESEESLTLRLKTLPTDRLIVFYCA